MKRSTILGGALFLGAALFTTSPLAQAGPSAIPEEPGRIVDLPSGAKGVLGLRRAPQIPIGSIILRRVFPDHPIGGPPRLPPGPGPGCDKKLDLTNQLGVVTVAVQDNGICSSADIDAFRRGDNTYVVQGGGEEAAWIMTDVSEPAAPVQLGTWIWVNGSGNPLNTYTPDVKAFRQGNEDYIVMGLERTSSFNAACGVVIEKVTNPASPVFQSQFIGDANGNGLLDLGDWCDVHNVFVETDSNSDGVYIYATADNTNDMRVLDIGGAYGGSVTNPVEVGVYAASTANNSNYVHDITVKDHGGAIGRRAYLAYWDSGLVVLDVSNGGTGLNLTEVIGPNELDPTGFLNHHSFPTPNGNFVFIQDEFLGAQGEPQTGEPVQMWDIDPTSLNYLMPVDGLALGSDVPVNPAHNLEIRDDIDPDRLFVGWYKEGLQAWDFDEINGGFVVPSIDTPSSALYNTVQTHKKDDKYDGAWAVRMESITHDVTRDGDLGPTNATNLYIFTSDRRYGLIIDCVDDATFSNYCPDPVGGSDDGGGEKSCNPKSPKCNP